MNAVFLSAMSIRRAFMESASTVTTEPAIRHAPLIKFAKMASVSMAMMARAIRNARKEKSAATANAWMPMTVHVIRNAKVRKSAKMVSASTAMMAHATPSAKRDTSASRASAWKAVRLPAACDAEVFAAKAIPQFAMMSKRFVSSSAVKQKLAAMMNCAAIMRLNSVSTENAKRKKTTIHAIVQKTVTSTLSAKLS
jgi:hypothetical protein